MLVETRIIMLQAVVVIMPRLMHQEPAALKSELAVRYPGDIGGYCDGKDSFVKRVERDALQWYWKTYGAAGRGQAPGPNTRLHFG